MTGRISTAEAQKESAKIDKEHDSQLEAATSDWERDRIQASRERAKLELGARTQWSSPHYDPKYAGMSDEDFQAELDKLNPEPGPHNPEAIRQRQAEYLGDSSPIAPEDVAEELSKTRNNSEIADVMKRAGLTADYQ